MVEDGSTRGYVIPTGYTWGLDAGYESLYETGFLERVDLQATQDALAAAKPPTPAADRAAEVPKVNYNSYSVFKKDMLQNSRTRFGPADMQDLPMTTSQEMGFAVQQALTGRGGAAPDPMVCKPCNGGPFYPLSSSKITKTASILKQANPGS